MNNGARDMLVRYALLPSYDLATFSQQAHKHTHNHSVLNVVCISLINE